MNMDISNQYDVIIIGGSYAGLQAATTLGRALRKVLVIDGGKPCNSQTPHSHNFLTQDGETPAAIAAKGKEQLAAYTTVSLLQDNVIEAVQVVNGFKTDTLSGATFTTRKLLFATGVKDIMPDIHGFAECWGISVIHCPYCHGYEVHHQPTGILANGDVAFEYAKLINNWTNELTVFTNGTSTLTAEQQHKLTDKNINIIKTELKEILHDQGQMKSLLFKDGSQQQMKALYARPPFEQHCELPMQLGCTLDEHGLLQTNGFGKTNVPGVYAAGDNSVLMRSVANAVATGMMAAAMLNKEMIEEDFN
jgi:thioredoxin reductase